MHLSRAADLICEEQTAMDQTTLYRCPKCRLAGVATLFRAGIDGHLVCPSCLLLFRQAVPVVRLFGRIDGPLFVSLKATQT
jgi:uncharacterized C2H2 Zn-finger protein